VDAPSWISKYLEPHLQDARTVLSVGCGPGVFLRELAAIRPNAEFVGVDLSAERIHEAETRLRGVSNARVQIGDAQALPFESGSFDFVFCRFLLEYLPDKQRASRRWYESAVAVGRYCSRTWTDSWYGHSPEDPELQQTIERVANRLASTGFDPFVGRKLFNLCFEAGLAEIKVQIDPYHLYAGTIAEDQFDLWQTKLAIAKPQLEKVLGSDEAAVKYTDRFLGTCEGRTL